MQHAIALFGFGLSIYMPSNKYEKVIRSIVLSKRTNPYRGLGMQLCSLPNLFRREYIPSDTRESPALQKGSLSFKIQASWTDAYSRYSVNH